MYILFNNNQCNAMWHNFCTIYLRDAFPSSCWAFSSLLKWVAKLLKFAHKQHNSSFHYFHFVEGLAQEKRRWVWMLVLKNHLYVRISFGKIQFISKFWFFDTNNDLFTTLINNDFTLHAYWLKINNQRTTAVIENEPKNKLPTHTNKEKKKWVIPLALELEI